MPSTAQLKLIENLLNLPIAEKIVEQVLKSNIRTVALQNNLTEDVVARMLKDVAEEKLEKKLGLDEIALVKGQGNYCAV